MKEIDWSKAPEGYDFALSPAADWNGAPALKGTVRFASRNGLGRFKDDTGMHPQIGRTSWEVIAERPAAWTGDGLPPVGAVCEVLNNTLDRPEWERCTILFMGKFKTVYESESCHERVADVSESWMISFRPLRTPEQIAAEAREKAISEMVDAIGHFGNLPATALFAACSRLHDAGYQKITE